MESNCDLVEQTIGYRFKKKKLLQEALTAAGAEGDGHDGNRPLASVGRAALQLAIAEHGHMKLIPRGETGEMQSLLNSKRHLASAATEIGVASRIKLCPKSGKASDYVVTLAMRAIIGAVWEDSHCLDTVNAIVKLLNPSVDLFQHVTTVSSPNLQPISDRGDIHGIISLVPPSTDVLPDLAPTLTVLSGLQDVGATDESIASLADHATAQPCSNFDFIPDHLACDAFNIPDLTWSPADMTLAIDSGCWEAASSSSRSPGPTSAGLKHTLDDINPSVSTLSMTGGLRSPKRPRLNASRSENDAFHDYLAGEDRRCMEHGVLKPGETYLSQDILNETKDTNSDSPFTRLLVGAGSASSIVTLRAALSFLRAGNVPSQPPAANLSACERFSAIERSERQITGLTLLKRCHILKLWEHHCAQNVLGDKWISVNVLPEGPRKKPGNPHNHARSQAIRATVECIFPGITERSEGYASRHNKIKRLLSLGQKLSMLTHKFGPGILGLICCEFDTTNASFPGVSDRMLCLTSIEDFERFLPILEKSQGGLLRNFSEAANPIVQHIMQGTVGKSQKFRLESAMPDEILKLPKGSRELLAILGE